MSEQVPNESGDSAREKLVAAAIELFRQHGFTATPVDRICTGAGVTKGAFFHHFKSKEAIAEAAVEEWCRRRVALYTEDLGDPNDDPLERFFRWIDGLIRSVRRPGEGPVCLLGMVAQEMAGEHEGMRELCRERLTGWTGLATQLLGAAKRVHRPRVDFDPEEVGWMLNSLWQGSLLVAKTRRDPEVVASNLSHARAYVEGLFAVPPTG